MTANVSIYAASLATAFDARMTYENAKNADNDSIQSTLKDMRKTVLNETIAAIMLAANVNSDFINRAERVNARFNVYSAEKVINIAQCAASVRALNHYTRAILLTAIAMQKVEMQMTHKDAQASCSLDVKSDKSREKHIVRYMKHIAANTASTQSSSSINALQMYDVLRETRDAANNVCYTVNVESDVTKKLCSYLNVKLEETSNVAE